MKAFVKRTGMVTVLVVAVAVTMTSGLAAYIQQCAAFISSGEYDDPTVGWLLGERIYTETTTLVFTSTGGWMGFGGSASRTTVTTTSYSIGTYQMDNGTRAELRCDSYKYA